MTNEERKLRETTARLIGTVEFDLHTADEIGATIEKAKQIAKAQNRAIFFRFNSVQVYVFENDDELEVRKDYFRRLGGYDR